jgi:7,8-dihydropterin-6-yl-methyl-4-(beta-D-ribofuranosyl)aminobenzene 5'-phosphate synthase
VLIENMKRLGIDPEGIDIVVLSHIHSDHTGGLEAFIRRNKTAEVFFPYAFPGEFQSGLQNFGVKATAVQAATKICTGVYSTGVLGSEVKEQSMIIATDKGVVAITGCAHPGIIRIVNTVRDLTGDAILLVMGGFHLAGLSRPELTEIPLHFRKSGVKYAGPCHCCGDLARRLFKNEYGNDFMDVGAGANIRFE